MEQQAKERLTGGVILVVLLVLLVPELLTGPRPAPPLAPAQPDQAPMRSYTLDLSDPAHAGSAPVAASTAAPASGAPEVPVTAVASATTAARAPAAQAPAAQAPKAQAPAAQAPKVRAPKVRAPVAPAPLVAAHEREPAAARHGTASWTVQLGTFSSRENAVRLVRSVKSHGFSASIGEVTRNGHPLFRVRVGSERDRAAAQKLLARLRATGEKGGEVVPR